MIDTIDAATRSELMRIYAEIECEDDWPVDLGGEG
jgi:hypothetical protein